MCRLPPLHDGRESKIQVGHVPVYDFSYLSQLINTLGRRMNTMIINSLWMHMEKRQYRTIKESIQAAFPAIKMNKHYGYFSEVSITDSTIK
jgi:hypothetical protein